MAAADPEERFTVARDYLDAQIGAVKETIANLERHHGQLHVELQRSLDSHEKEQAERVKVALDAIDRRLDGMNEFRASLEDVTKQAVTRDLFDVVTNRVTVVENTYVKKEDYAKDGDRLRERVQEDLESVKNIIAERANANADRINALEKNTVRQEVYDAQAAEASRTRKTLYVSFAVLAIGWLFNLILNVWQQSGARTP